MSLLQQIVVLCPLVFFAGFVDSIAGGGGIISLPAYYIIGLTPHMAIGTNKFSASFGTAVSTYRFFKNGSVNVPVACVSVAAALVGSWCGSNLALIFSERALQYVMIIILPVLALLILCKKGFIREEGKPQRSLKKTLLLSVVFAFFIGGYDGFFGPGTGTFLILVFNTIIGFDMLTSSGNAKVVNLSSNLAALAVFLWNGQVMVLLGIPAAVCSIAGSYIGSGLALKRGVKVIKPIFICVLVILLVKVGLDVFA